jgi:hypothetical protein
MAKHYRDIWTRKYTIMLEEWEAPEHTEVFLCGFHVLQMVNRGSVTSSGTNLLRWEYHLVELYSGIVTALRTSDIFLHHSCIISHILTQGLVLVPLSEVSNVLWILWNRTAKIVHYSQGSCNIFSASIVTACIMPCLELLRSVEVNLHLENIGVDSWDVALTLRLPN